MLILCKRGTTVQCDAITPEEAEPLYDKTLKQFRIGDGATAGAKKVAMVSMGESRVFSVNAFHFPVPATEWKPTVYGAYLPVSQTAKKCWLPLNFLKAGDIITAYSLV